MVPVRRTIVSLVLALLTLCAALAGQQPAVSYVVTPDVGARSYHVSMSVRDVHSSPLEVRIPAWCPGWYVLTEYHKNIRRVSAKTASGVRLQVDDEGDRVWRVENRGASGVVVEYQVRGNDAGFGFFGSHLSERNGFINPASLCMYPTGRTQEPVSIRFDLPSGWNIATALDEGGREGEFVAQDYDELVDSPFELGHFKRVDFEAAGVPMFVTFTYRGEMRPNAEKIVSELKLIAETQIAMFGGAPMKRYFWNIHLDTGSFGGGLEHRASTTLNVQNSADLDIRWLASHEFFHLWNVKRIRPKLLGPFDYTGPQRTGNLWFAEGVTSYYGDLTLYRAGMIDREQWLRTITNQIETLQNSSDRLKYSAEEASRRAWEGGSQGYGNLSYYNKGFLIGLLLDLSIRTRTAGEKSLDDVMRHMLEKHAPPKPGYDEDGILVAINEVTGLDFTPLYTRLARTTEELPYSEVFAAAGLRYGGGERGESGLTLVLAGAQAYPRVQEVSPNSMAETMGLQPGDFIVSVNGTDARGSADPLAGIGSGDEVVISALRRSQKLSLTGTMGSRSASGTTLALSPNPTPLQQRILDGWLKR